MPPPQQPNEPVHSGKIKRADRELYKPHSSSDVPGPRAAPNVGKPRAPPDVPRAPPDVPRDLLARLRQVPHSSCVRRPGSDNSNLPPVAEADCLRHLAGLNLSVLVSHIEDPHNLFVERKYQWMLYKELLEEFKNAISLPKPSERRLTKADRELYKPHSSSDVPGPRAAPNVGKPRAPPDVPRAPPDVPRDLLARLRQVPHSSCVRRPGSDNSNLPPVAEADCLRHLAGLNLSVLVSHIEDPHNLFVERKYQWMLYKELLEEFKNAISLPKPSERRLTKGKICLVQNCAGNWLRCRVVSVRVVGMHRPLYKVFCFDVGSTEFVNIDRLRVLPVARHDLPPPLACHCRLAHCSPRGRAWTPDDADLLEQILNDKWAKLHVFHAFESAIHDITLVCHITTYEWVSLVLALVFHDRARLRNTVLWLCRGREDFVPYVNCGIEEPVVLSNTHQ